MKKLTLDDVRLALSEMGVKAAESMSDDEFETAKFKDDLKMNKSMVLVLISTLKNKHHIFVPSGIHCGLGSRSTVGIFVSTINHYLIDLD